MIDERFRFYSRQQCSAVPYWLVGHSEVETPAGVKFSTYGLPVIGRNQRQTVFTGSVPTTISQQRSFALLQISK